MRFTTFLMAALVAACNHSSSVETAYMHNLAASLPTPSPKPAGQINGLSVSPFYFTPYRSQKPIIHVGKFSDGLASTNEDHLVATILRMKQQWSRLNHVELYVGAVRLYNFGYRNEATYWYYSASYLWDCYTRLVDVRKMGGQGTPSMDMYTAGELFGEDGGPQILGFALLHESERQRILHAVNSDRAHTPEMEALYPGIAFVSKARWPKASKKALLALANYRNSLPVGDTYGYDPWGYTWDYSHLTSKHFPGGF
jgi:hypothetical protein